MEGNISQALQLLAVGMLTVFMILLIVINFGKLLILAVNKFAPEEEVVKKGAPAKSAAPQAVDATVKAVIDAAVSQITGGKGHAAKITKL